METKANFVLIGAFTLAVIGAAFGFVFWFQSLGAAAQRMPLRIVFEGAASGLRTGGNVNFNGIKIGEVTSIKLDDPKRVVVITAVDKSAPIRKDSLVGLEFAGLTGVSSISLKGGTVEAGGVPVGDDGVPRQVWRRAYDRADGRPLYVGRKANALRHDGGSTAAGRCPVAGDIIRVIYIMESYV